MVGLTYQQGRSPVSLLISQHPNKSNAREKGLVHLQFWKDIVHYSCRKEPLECHTTSALRSDCQVGGACRPQDPPLWLTSSQKTPLLKVSTTFPKSTNWEPSIRTCEPVGGVSHSYDSIWIIETWQDPKDTGDDRTLFSWLFSER